MGVSGNMMWHTVSGVTYGLIFDAENRLVGVSGAVLLVPGYPDYGFTQTRLDWINANLK